MKLYMHPVSTTSRPVMMFIAENGIDVDMQTVDLMSGEHMNAAYAAINPNQLVPVLEDGDFSANRKLGDPEIPRRFNRFAGLSKRSQTARPGQRVDGLVQYRFLSRVRLRPDLPPSSFPITNAKAMKRSRRRSPGRRKKRATDFGFSTTVGSGPIKPIFAAIR